jgi:hypothetical protein
MIYLSNAKCMVPFSTKMIRKIVLLSVLIAIMIATGMTTPAISGDILRYQVVTSGSDNAYLVDTTTGFTWILSYRTLPTGREPVAIPYKFIGVTPQTQSNFLTESAPLFPDQARDAK